MYTSRLFTIVFLLCVPLVVAFSGSGASGQQATFDITVSAGKWDRAQTPVCAEVKLPQSLARALGSGELCARVVSQAGEELPAQVVPGAGGAGAAEIWFILPNCPAGKTVRFTARVFRGTPAQGGFSFRDVAGKYLDLLFAGRPVTRLMYEWDPNRREETYKVYHHVFDPQGKRPITKGPGGKYTHHRGIFIGWRSVEFAGKKYDFWHMKTVTQQLKQFTENIAGPVLARSTATIEWNDPQGKPVITEQRTLVAYRQSGAILLDWSTALKSNVGPVFLNGDMHHAGIQFRAANEVVSREKETFYIYPPQGVERPNAPKVPWVAMSFALGDRRFTVAHMNHPDNPPDTVYSEKQRHYGRFGAFFTYHLKPDETLRLKYRFYIVEGKNPPTAEEIDARYLDFIAPPQVTATPR